MQNLQELADLAKDLPEATREAAMTLVERMGTTLEGIGDEPVAWRPPLLRIVQATTDRSTLPKGTGIGDLLIGEEKAATPLEFVPLRLWKARQYWDPNPDNKKMLCQSPDAKVGYIGQECRTCPHAEWVEGQGSECNKIYTMMAITADLSQIFLTNFAKTSYSVGTEFENTMKKAGVAMYSRQYSLGSKTNKTYEMLEVSPLDTAKRRTPDGHLPFLKALFDQIGAGRKEAIEGFYKLVEDRRAAGLIPIASEATKAIGNSTDTGDSTLAIPAETAPAEASGKLSKTGTKYSV